jgi:hypothetical protein
MRSPQDWLRSCQLRDREISTENKQFLKKDFFTEGNEENEGCFNTSLSNQTDKNIAKLQREAPSLTSLPSVKNSDKFFDSGFHFAVYGPH